MRRLYCFAQHWQAEAILMWKATLAAAVLMLTAAQQPAFANENGRIAEIRERLENANRWRDHVMVVAHRGGGMEGDRKSHPENSVAAVLSAIDLGVEMVELDVQKSRDGEFVVFHDSWLDRSSTCRGELAKRTLAELKQCRLVIAGTGAATDEPIPTLREMLEVTRGRVFVNVDNKLDIEALPAIVAVAREIGMADQIVIKRNLWSAEKIIEMRGVLDRAGADAVFMPIIADDAARDPKFLEAATSTFSADAVELIAWHKGGEPMTENGGPLFGAKARAVAARGDWHLWVNTYAIINKPAGMLSGGRGDQLATAAGLPGEAFGFWVDRGATIIQTDEPKAAIEWLEANGYRVPYAGDGADLTQAVAEIPPGQ
jgi:glycerophosphoryl diester phosphodiesterase